MENIKRNYKDYGYTDKEENISIYQEISKLEKRIKENLNIDINKLEIIYNLMKVERTKENLLEIIKSVNDKFNEWDRNPLRNR